MSNTVKRLSERDYSQNIQQSFQPEDGSLNISGFVVGLVGRKVTATTSTTSVSGDTTTFAFSENGNALYSIKVIYTDSTQSTFISAERTA